MPTILCCSQWLYDQDKTM